MMIYTLFGAMALAAPTDFSKAEVIVSGEPTVRCAPFDGQRWCQSVGRFDVPVADVAKVLEDPSKFPTVFPRVTTADPLSEDVLHIVLDMPFPLSNRDYVAKFDVTESNGSKVISWSAVTHPKAPRPAGVRLTKAAGSWTLTPDGTGTKMTYVWNGELGGGLPAWIHRRAWTLQGTEILGWIDDALAGRKAAAAAME